MKCLFLIDLRFVGDEPHGAVLEKWVDLQAPPMVGFLVFPGNAADAAEVVNVIYDMEDGIFRVLLEEIEISDPLIYDETVELYRAGGWK